MKHIREVPFAELEVSAGLRRARLFELCRQQHRAASFAADQTDHTDPELSDEDLDDIRERAVRSFARPA